MKVNTSAKLNLGLDITSKREDGYHELKTVFYEIPLHNVLSFNKKNTPGISVDSDDKTLELGEKNLVYRAVSMLFADYDIHGGMDIFIEKRVPSGAGLGGGSADAAAALKTVNSMFSLNISDDKLKDYGVRLGADVPFFITGGAAVAGGIGDILSPLPDIKMFPFVLVKPKCSVSTVEAYRAADEAGELFHPDMDALIKALRAGCYEDICQYLGNSFEIPVFNMYPEIKRVKEALMSLGAGAGMMTGSGSAVFAVFKSIEEAEAAAKGFASKIRDAEVFVF